MAAVDTSSFFKRIVTHQAFVPVLVVCVLILVLGLSANFYNVPPSITSVSPGVGNPGDLVVIQGSHFGTLRQGSTVQIGGKIPASSEYLHWTDTKITLKLPNDLPSGFLYVTTQSGKSNGYLFTNLENIPSPVLGPADPGIPYVTEIQPSEASVGSLVTVSGMNFGFSRETSKVYFSFLPPDTSLMSLLIPVSETDFGYETWSDREIKLRVPDGASTGNVIIVTDKGKSNAAYFEVANQSGTKVYSEKRTYNIAYGVSVSVETSDPGSGLYLWVPRIPESLNQRNVQLMYKEPEPGYENHNGFLLYQFKNLESGSKSDVSTSWIFDCYAVSTEIKTDKVKVYDTSTALYKFYTAPDELVHSDLPNVVSVAKKQAAYDKNPLRRARLVYDYVLAKLKFNPEVSVEPDTLLAGGEASSYEYAVLFVTLCRASAVPARLVSGIVVDSSTSTYVHYWAEFYLEGFGWVSADPALGDGGKYEGMTANPDAKTFFFGNLDNEHIALSHGLSSIGSLIPKGIAVKKGRGYSLQTMHEEYTENLILYTSTWRPVTITGIY